MALECGLYIDLPYRAGTPKVGDVVVSVGKRGPGTAYLVLRVHEVQRRKRANQARFQMKVQKVPLEDAAVAPRWDFKWYPRRRSNEKQSENDNRRRR